MHLNHFPNSESYECLLLDRSIAHLSTIELHSSLSEGPALLLTSLSSIWSQEHPEHTANLILTKISTCVDIFTTRIQSNCGFEITGTATQITWSYHCPNHGKCCGLYYSAYFHTSKRLGIIMCVHFNSKPTILDIHNILKQCVFGHVDPKNITMDAVTSANSMWMCTSCSIPWLYSWGSHEWTHTA